MSDRLSQDQMRAVLARAVAAAGGIRPWCAKHDMASHSAVSMMLSGRREVSEIAANCCGYIAETTFRRLAKDTTNA